MKHAVDMPELKAADSRSDGGVEGRPSAMKGGYVAPSLVALGNAREILALASGPSYDVDTDSLAQQN